MRPPLRPLFDEMEAALRLLESISRQEPRHPYEIWAPDHAQDTQNLRMFMRKLRRKIERDPSHPGILLTELGIGYRIAYSQAKKRA